MIELNPQYESIFDPRNIDDDCEKIARLMNIEAQTIMESLHAGQHNQAITMYLQLLKAMCTHFVDDEHWCYFDDWYSPDFVMRELYELIMKLEINADSEALLQAGHDEISHTNCYGDYGLPSFIR